jgi:hypothetical protein
MLNIAVSLKRKNCMASVKLRCKATGVVFGVSTYHMPCAHKKEEIMMIHAALAFQQAHRYKSAPSGAFARVAISMLQRLGFRV